MDIHTGKAANATDKNTRASHRCAALRGRGGSRGGPLSPIRMYPGRRKQQHCWTVTHSAHICNRTNIG